MRDAALRGWHALDSWRGDAIAAAILIALLLSLLAAGGQLSGPGRPFEAACAAGVCGCLALRRASPPLAALAAAAILGLAGWAGPSAGDPFGLIFVVIFLLAYSLGASLRLGPSVLAVVLLGAGLQVAVATFNPFVVIITAGRPGWSSGPAVSSPSSSPSAAANWRPSASSSRRSRCVTSGRGSRGNCTTSSRTASA